MPTIPMPNVGTPGQQQARSIPEFGVQATGDAFGAGAAEATYRGQTALIGNIAQAAKAENSMWNAAIGGIGNAVMERVNADLKLEAEAKLHELALGQTKAQSGIEASGDYSSVQKGLEGFDAASQALIDSAKTPKQADWYREGVQKLRFQHEREAVGREVAAIKQARIDNLERISEASQLEVLKDPSRLDAIMASSRSTIEGANLTPHQKSKAIQAQSANLIKIALEARTTRNDFGGAAELLKRDDVIMALGPLDALRAQKSVSKAAVEWQETQDAAARSKRLMEGLEPLDPADKDQRKLVDDAFDKTKGPQLLADMDANAAGFVGNMAKKYGVVPKSAIGILSGQSINGTDDQQIFALQTVAMVETAKPGTFEVSGANARLRAEAEDFRHLTSGLDGQGLDPQTALKRIQEKRTPEFQAKAAARKESIADKRNGPLSAINPEAELVKAFDDSYWGDPAVGNPRDKDVVVGIYRRSLEDHYIRTGDPDMAKAAALADMRKTFGVTRMSGDGTARVVRNPIEQVYPAINGSHDYIREQAAAEIKAATGKTVDPNTIFFENTRDTEVAISRGGFQTGSAPAYGFYWRAKGDDGVVRDQTIPGMTFRPDMNKARAEATTKATTERATKAERDQYAPHMLIRKGLKKLGVPGLPDDPDARKEAKAADKLKTETEGQTAASDIMDMFGWGAQVTQGAP
jgi:hypothetical protein